MRRSARLTAVFALVVGIVLTLGANPGAAQPQPQPQVRAHAYLLRGLMNIFSLGMDTLAEQLKRRGVYATVHNYAECKHSPIGLLRITKQARKHRSS